MSDRWAVGAAAAAWAGALLAHGFPLPVCATVALAALLGRHPAPALVAVLLVTSTLAGRATDGLEPPEPQDFDGTVTLVTDPKPTIDGDLELQVAGRRGRLLAEVTAPDAIAALAPRLAGDRASVTGRVTPFTRATAWTRSRHLAGRLEIDSVTALGSGSPLAEAANRLRRTLESGAQTLAPRHRALLSGLVLGDDRAQPPELTADFRAAGLTHLLAVSGQNVMFVLAVAGPLLRRLRLWPRFFVAVGVVAGFALVTRLEPSVLRAAFVAGVALFARTTGRASGGLRHLAIAVAGLLVVDPLLVHSLGFRLSVAASLGVLVLGPRIVAGLRGPRWFRDGLGVTAGAQLAVAPVLVPVLGPMPLAALPANVVAGPIAGMLMVWGLTAGTVAGVAGGPLAWLLHRPSTIGLHALEAVAATGAGLPLGQFDLRHVAVLSAAGASAVLAARSGRTGFAVAAALVAVGAVLAPVATPVVAGPRPAGPDATVWIDGPLAVVDLGRRADPVDVLEALRTHRVVGVPLVVVHHAGPRSDVGLDALAARFPVGAVLGPPGLRHEEVTVPVPGLRVRAGRFVVVVDRPGPPLRARIAWATDSARSPPARPGP